MLAFDIETTGLQPETDLVTVVSTYDGYAAQSFLFVCINKENGKLQYRPDFEEIKTKLCNVLENAPMLAAFNGFKFDIPFLQKALKLDIHFTGRLMIKTFDPFQICKLMHQRTFPLNMLLELNNMSVKTGSGTNAITQAQEGRFAELCQYCEDDARLTYEVCQKPELLIPESFLWRKQNNQKTIDPANILKMKIKVNNSKNGVQYEFVEEKDLVEIILENNELD